MRTGGVEMKNIFPLASAAIGMGILCGCFPGTARPPIHPTLRISSISQQSPLLTRTRTATAAATTLPAITDLPTSTTTKVSTPTWTPTITRSGTPTRASTNTSWIDSWPTPTRGLPPKATPGPKQTCPSPTHAAVSFQFAEDPLAYGPQILEYVRAKGNASGLSSILNQFKVSLTHGDQSDLAASYAADVTGDTTNEIIVTLVQAGTGEVSMYGEYPESSMLVFIVGCVDNQYQMLYQKNLANVINVPEFPQYPPRIIRLEDLNANGVREIVFSSLYFTGKYFDNNLQVQVLEWNGNSFGSLLLPREAGIPLTTNADPEFRDVDGNGTIDILLPDRSSRHECDEGPWRVVKSIYMWDGQFYRDMWIDPGSPTYRFEAAFDGDYFTGAGLFDKAEASYRRAIHDTNLPAFDYAEWSEKVYDGYCRNDFSDPDEALKIVAYSRLRLLELHVFLGRQEDAKADWEYIRTHYSEGTAGYVYAALAKTFWDTYSANADIGTACAAVREQSDENESEVFVWMILLYGFNNSSLSRSQSAICPFPSVPDYTGR
jgi:hypothetical protein